MTSPNIHTIKYFRSMLDVRRRDIFLGGKPSSPLNRVFHDSSEGVYNWIFISYMYRASSSSLETLINRLRKFSERNYWFFNFDKDWKTFLTWLNILLPCYFITFHNKLLFCLLCNFPIYSLIPIINSNIGMYLSR